MQLFVAVLSLAFVSSLGPIAPTATAYAVAAPVADALAVSASAPIDGPQFGKRGAGLADDIDEALSTTTAEDAKGGVPDELWSLLTHFRRGCTNGGAKLARAVGACDPARSSGSKSARACRSGGGRHYYCVLGGQAKCFTHTLKWLNIDNGECFS